MSHSRRAHHTFFPPHAFSRPMKTASLLLACLAFLTSHALAAPLTPAESLAALRSDAPDGQGITPGLPASARMFVGDVRIFHLDKPIKTIAVGNGKVLSSSVIENGDLLVLAQDAGDTTVHVWDKARQHHVMRMRVDLKDMSRVRDEIRTALGDTPGLQVRTVGDRVLIEGQNLAQSTKQLVEAVSKLYPQATDMTSLSSRNGLLEPMIIYELNFIEFKRSRLEDIGIKWDAQSTGGIRLGYSDKGFTAETSLSFGSVIHLAVSRGDAYVLASPRLSSRSGGKAKFLAGGEIPLQSIGSNGSSNIIFKQYGIILNLEGSVVGANGVSGSVLAEVSSIDSSVTIQGLPGFLTRRTESEYNMHEGETIVLSGLFNKENASAIDKVPLLGNIPILGEFFRNTNVTGKDVELVVFITPRVYTAESALNRQEIGHGVSGVNNTARRLGDGEVMRPDGPVRDMSEPAPSGADDREARHAEQ